MTPKIKLMNAELLDRVKQHAVENYAIDLSTVSVETKEQTWSSGALGCPKKGYYYTSAMVTGWRVSLKTAEKEVIYHTDEDNHFVVAGVR